MVHMLYFRFSIGKFFKVCVLFVGLQVKDLKTPGVDDKK